MKNSSWKKFPVLFSLYIAQSVPMSFFSTVVPVIMRQENYSLESIGLLQLVKLPWIIKFFWAPLVDRTSQNEKGYKRWIYFSEIFYAIVIISIAFLDLQTDFSLIIGIMVIAFIASATQDIATDAFAILILKRSERSMGNSMQSAGSFMGALMGTGVLLIAYYYFGWRILLLLLSGFVLFAIVPLFLYKKETGDISGRPPVRINLSDVFRFFGAPGMHKRILILVFYYSGIIGILAMIKPYMVDLGYSVSQIGFMSGIVGTSVAALAALGSGYIIKKTGRRMAWFLFASINLLAALVFVVLSTTTPSMASMYLAICLVWGAYGLSSVIIYTTSMDMVRKGREGTDFTSQIVLTHLSGMLIAMFSGKAGDLFGYTGLFLMEAALAAFSIVLLFYALPKTQKIKVPPGLLEKYNQPVPRYTSYPTANNFTQPITTNQYLDLVKASNQKEPSNIAFYIHIPFCLKICSYCGCNSLRLTSEEEYTVYHRALLREIETVLPAIDKSRRVTQIHFGGGTPNAIPVALLKEIKETITASFSLNQDAEIAIECNPSLLGHEYIRQLKEAGFNRFSLGIQDFNEVVLQRVNRDAASMPLEEMIEAIRSGDQKATVNLDFIFGLPGQTSTSFSDTMKKAAALQPDRLVTFSYAHVPWMKKNQAMLGKDTLPSAEEKLDMFLAGNSILSSAGYRSIGLDHYVQPEDQLYHALGNSMLHRNFQGYCTRTTTGQVYAFGASAISQLEQAYVQNTRSLKDYIQKIDDSELPVERGRVLNADEKVVREVITHLMCNKEIDWKKMSAMTGLPVEEIHKILRIDHEALSAMAADGLLEYSNRHLRVTPEGSLFIRNIAAALDPAYQPEQNKHSASV